MWKAVCLTSLACWPGTELFKWASASWCLLQGRNWKKGSFRRCPSVGDSHSTAGDPLMGWDGDGLGWACRTSLALGDAGPRDPLLSCFLPCWGSGWCSGPVAVPAVGEVVLEQEPRSRWLLIVSTLPGPEMLYHGFECLWIVLAE